MLSKFATCAALAVLTFFPLFFYVNSISSRYAYDGVFIVALVKKGKAEGTPSCLHDDRVRNAIPKPLLRI